VAQDFVRFAYLTGLRRGSIRDLTWDKVRQEEEAIRIPRTKNGRPVLVPIVGELLGILERRLACREVDGVLVPSVFHHRRGQPLKSFRKTWSRAVAAAGKPDLKFHDLRRSFARNCRLRGLSETEAMTLGGWKTAEVFRRYNVMCEADVRDAARRAQGDGVTPSARAAGAAERSL